MLNGAFGAAHALEFPFVFDDIASAERIIGSLEAAQPLVDTMSDAWVSFARDGTPAARGLPDWKPFDAEQRTTMIFDREPRLERDPDAHLRAIWGSLD